MVIKMNKRKIITKYIQDYLNVNLFDFEGNIDEVIAMLQNAKEKAEEKGYSDIKVVIEYDDRDECNKILISGKRLETFEEMEKRLKNNQDKRNKTIEKNKILKREKEKKEREEYERLKKKFG